MYFPKEKLEKIRAKLKKEKSIKDLIEDDKVEFYKNMKELEDDMNHSFY